MMQEILPDLVIIGMLLVCSGFFSGTEVAMFSLRRVDRQLMARSERRSDRLVLSLLAKPRKLIASLLIGNELVNISISVVVAGVVSTLWPGLSKVELILVATGAALPLMVGIGEISPKAIAYRTSLGWARKTARPLWLFTVVVTPLRVIVHGITSVLMKPFASPSPSATAAQLSAEEFKALVDAGSAEGQVNARERRLIHRVFEFGDKTADQVMQPRKRVFALAYDLPTARLIKEIAAGGYSRVPIYHKSLDRILGIVYAKDLVVQGTGLSAPRRLQDMLHDPLFVPRTMRVERVFRIFKQRKTHMAIVVNEYGKTIGLLTMEDLLEELFGEIADERERQKARSTGAPQTGPVPKLDRIDEDGGKS
ncbi:MAG TPA: hemolysin family protein [Kofleriaceae bacterium]|nr:hemolysin family protein [Kofleriaceae bacterium]